MRLMTPAGRLASVGVYFFGSRCLQDVVRPLERRCVAPSKLVGLQEDSMTAVWALASLWLGLALIASLLAIWLRISSALSEIVVGTIAQLVIGAAIGSAVLGTDESWIKFLSGIGAIVLTFLGGAELDPAVFRLKWKEAVAI